MTDFLDEKHREITDRLAELQPLVEEYQRLEAAVAALEGLGRSAAAPAAAPKAAAKAAPKATAKRPAKKLPAAVGRAARAGRKPNPKKQLPPRRQRQRQRRRRGRGGARRKAGRRKGSGTRAAQALSFVQAQAGITIPELAARMGIKQNYLYRVLPDPPGGRQGTQARQRLAPQGVSLTSTRCKTAPACDTPGLYFGGDSVQLSRLRSSRAPAPPCALPGARRRSRRCARGRTRRGRDPPRSTTHRRSRCRGSRRSGPRGRRRSRRRARPSRPSRRRRAEHPVVHVVDRRVGGGGRARRRRAPR